MLFSMFSLVFASQANANENVFDDFVTVIEKSTAAGNLPAIIDDAGATRGASFNGQYVFVASRQNGNHVYYWDVNNPDAPPQGLNMDGISGGLFTVNDVVAIGDQVFVSNMTLAGGLFRVYHWNGLDASPQVLIEVPSAPDRLGDAITVLGDVNSYASIVVSAHGASKFYIWYLNYGELESDEPSVVSIEGMESTNFYRATLFGGHEEYTILSGPFGVWLLDEESEPVAFLEQAFFPAWPMYVNVFEYDGGRYLSYMHVRDNPAENVLYILDLNDGDNPVEAFESLVADGFDDRIVHSHDLGSVSNGNASVSNEVVVDIYGNFWVMGFAAGNGFVAKRLGDNFFYTLPFMETFDGEGEDTPDTWLPDGWSIFSLDDDGEEFTWYWSPGPAADPNGQMRSQSAYQEDGSWFALNPDNWLVTPQIVFSDITEDQMIELTFKVGTGAQTPAFKQENYAVLISTTDTDPESFTTLWEETLATDLPQNELQLRTIDLSEYAGEPVYIAFRHYDVTDMDRLLLDDVFIVVKTEGDDDDPVADLTLNVRMVVWADLGDFDPDNDFVDVAGSFNDWGGEELLLTPLDDEFLTYTITIPELLVGETYEFKFRINGSWDDDTAEFPFGGPAREVTIAESNNEYTFWYNDDEPTSVDQIAQNQLNLFPNPARTQLTIVSEENMTLVTVSDITGRQVVQQAVSGFEYRMDVSGLSNGVYIVGVHTENGVAVQKIQIQK